MHNLKNKRPKPWYRISAAAFYFLQGLIFASWASRIPDIKNALGMNEAQLGAVLFLIPVGQLSVMALSGYLVSRFGSRVTLLAASVAYAAALVLLGVAQTIMQLSAGMVFFGMSANLFNISVNTQAVGIERLYRRSIMASFHGLWSLAGFFGGLISVFMVAADITPLVHFSVVSVFALCVVFLMGRSVLPRDETRHADKEAVNKKIFTKPDKLVVILGIMAFGSMVCEGTMFDWSAVYFEEVVGPPKNLIRLGYIASMCSMAGGRFAADRLITRFGVVNVLKASGLTIAAGLLLAVVFPVLPVATAGFLLVGLGVSSIVPICYSLAGKGSSMLPGVAIAMVSTIGFLGFLVGPPVIGFVGHSLGLRWALGGISLAGIAITVLAPFVKLKK